MADNGRRLSTASYIAGELEGSLQADAADGFNVIGNHYAQPLEDFCLLVMPELQRCGIFRTEYTGATLRDHVGLRVPANRNTAQRNMAAALSG